MGVLDMGGSDQDVDPGQSSVPHECYTPGIARRDSFTGIDHPASGDVLIWCRALRGVRRPHDA